MTNSQPPHPRTTRAWQDPARSVAERVDALLEAMTLEEKVGQLGSRWVGGAPALDPAAPDPDLTDPDLTGPGGKDADGDQPDLAAKSQSLNMAPMQDVFAAAGSVPLPEASRNGLGHLTRVYGSAPLTAVEGAAELIAQQRVVLDVARLAIPALVHEECLTGFTTYGATVYPSAIAWGATFDPDLVERMASRIGADMAALGVHQGLSPVLDVVRDYRWGRVEETMGEDPVLVGVLGSAYIRGLQSAGVIATAKHFAGYSASRGARNHGPVSMGRRELADVILPPFEAAIRLGGVGSFMNSYSDIDGVPAGADPWLLTGLLRETWGFTGTVVSDYWAVPFLATMHGVAANTDDAGAAALRAGIDVELPDTVGYGSGLIERVRSGDLDETLIDRAARRLLTQKVQLGLLDPDWTPERSVAGAQRVDLDSAGNRALAGEMAEKSIVLLDPGSALPLLGSDRPPLTRVAVVGPCAADARTFLGCYAFPNHVLPRHPELGLGIEVPTAFDALREELTDVGLVHEPGCTVTGHDKSGFAAARAAVESADLCVALVGDLAGLFGAGTSGEGCDAEDLRLPGVQADLLEELLATATPVVVVVVSGRPYALGAVYGRAAGLVQAFMPGEEGGPAIAGVLSGRIQPSGHLPVQIPRHAGGQPGTYLQPPLGATDTGVSSLEAAPLFSFGHGRSYTSFEVSSLRLSRTEVPTDGEFTASVRLRNTGPRWGTEVVQLYLSDPVASVARPVRQLVGFARVELPAGAEADITFAVSTDLTSFTGRDFVRIVEPGDIDIAVGTSATDLPCHARIVMTGPTRTVGHERQLISGVTVAPVGP